MRKLIPGLFLIFIFTTLLGKNYRLSFSENSEVEFSLEKWNLKNVIKDGNNFSQIGFSSATELSRKGFAKLPFVKASIMVDDESSYRVKVVSEEYTDVKLDFPLLPSKGDLSRSLNPDTVPYVIDPESVTNNFYPEKAVRHGSPFIIRDVRGMNIYIHPFRYNAAKRTLRVYENLKIKIVKDGKKGRNILLRKKSSRVDVFENVYKSLFINYPIGKISRNGNLMREIGDLLVIFTERDREAAKDYIEWKREKGFKVFEKIVEKGANVTGLVRDEYEKNGNLLYIQLFGDYEDVQSDLEYLQTPSGHKESSPVDPMLGCVSGDDIYPDLIVGRFSANSAEEAAVQVRKTVDYEKNPDPEGEWYGRALGISSSQGEVKETMEKVISITFPLSERRNFSNPPTPISSRFQMLCQTVWGRRILTNSSTAVSE